MSQSCVSRSKVMEEPAEIDDPMNPYEKIIMPQTNDEDIHCDICLDGEFEDDD